MATTATAARYEAPRLDLPALRRSLRRTLGVAIAAQAALALLLAQWPGPARLGAGYFALALPWTLGVGAVLTRSLHLLQRDDGSPLARLNLATKVTLLRLFAVPLVIGLVLAGRLPAAGAVALLAALSDGLDGALARRRGEVTQLGRIADPSIDALFCGSTLAALALAGALPGWVVLLAGLRYALLAGGALALRLLAGSLTVRATVAGRRFYALQYGLLVLLLLVGAGEGELAVALRRWIPPALGALQLLVIAQLAILGRNLYAELRRG